MIRDATRADDAAAFAVMRSPYPEFVTTKAGFRHRQVTLLVTDNEERNAPMLAVKERLRFRPHTAHDVYVRESGNGFRASAGST